MADPRSKVGSHKQLASAISPTLEQVARAAINACLATSIRRRKEYGGMIYLESGRFVAKPAETQDEPATVNVGQDLPNCGCPDNTKPVAYYHTHPIYSIAGFKGSYNEFSDEDKAVAKKFEIYAFVGTLDGSFFLFDWKSDRTLRLGGRLNNNAE
jgi:hypothetical protein